MNKLFQKYLPLFHYFLFILIFACTNKSSDEVVRKIQIPETGWVDEDTYILHSAGSPPQGIKDLATAKLLGCENARTSGITYFNNKYHRESSVEKKSSLEEYDQNFKIEISTVEKRNDQFGNCTLKMRFRSKGLKQRVLSPPKEKTIEKENTKGW